MLAHSIEPARDRAASVCDLLRESDALIARAIRLLGSGNGIAAATGLPAERVLELNARRMRPDAQMLMNAGAEQHTMSRLFDAFDRGVVSWSQVRAIVAAVRPLAVAARTAIDTLIGDHADALKDAEPYRLVQLVDDEVARRLPDVQRNREDRQITTEFLAVQTKLDGGASVYGEYGPVAAATIVDALDAWADRPFHAHEDDATTRAQQRGEALLRICEATLAGSATDARPRPRFLAVLDVNRYAKDQNEAAMKVLWALAGRTPRLTRVAADEHLCDATIIPILTTNGRPVEVGDETTTFSDKVRRAIIARDQGCRAPGCTAPAAWTDVHHLQPGVGNKEPDGALHCRRDHRRAHRNNWKIRWLDGGILEYTIKGKIYLSRPRT